MPHLVWQCSDVAAKLPGVHLWLDEAALPNLPPPLALDVNQGLPAGALRRGLYRQHAAHHGLGRGAAPVHRPGLAVARARPVQRLRAFQHRRALTSEGNARSDAELRLADPRRGIRDLKAVDALARDAGLRMLSDDPMPANNLCVTWQRAALS
jgi:hypothetical protein